MSDTLARLRDALAEVESCAGDIESDIDGLDAMASDIRCRPAVAIINDLAKLCDELRDALTLDGKALSAVAAALGTNDAKFPQHLHEDSTASKLPANEVTAQI